LLLKLRLAEQQTAKAQQRLKSTLSSHALDSSQLQNQLQTQLSDSLHENDRLTKQLTTFKSLADTSEQKRRAVTEARHKEQLAAQQLQERYSAMQSKFQEITKAYEVTVKQLSGIKTQARSDQENFHSQLNSLNDKVTLLTDEKERVGAKRMELKEKVAEQTHQLERATRENARLREERNRLRDSQKNATEASESELKRTVTDLDHLEKQLSTKTDEFVDLERHYKTMALEYQDSKHNLEHKLARETSIRARVELELRQKKQKVEVLKQSIASQEKDLKSKLTKVHLALASSNETIRNLRAKLALRPTPHVSYDDSYYSEHQDQEQDRTAVNSTRATSPGHAPPRRTTSPRHPEKEVSPRRLAFGSSQPKLRGAAKASPSLLRASLEGHSTRYEHEAASPLAAKLNRSQAYPSSSRASKSNAASTHTTSARSLRTNSKHITPKTHRSLRHGTHGKEVETRINESQSVIFSNPSSIRKSGLLRSQNRNRYNEPLYVRSANRLGNLNTSRDAWSVSGSDSPVSGSSRLYNNTNDISITTPSSGGLLSAKQPPKVMLDALDDARRQLQQLEQRALGGLEDSRRRLNLLDANDQVNDTS